MATAMDTSEQEPPRVDWRRCPARAVLLDDLKVGVLSLDAIETSVDEAWEMYREREEFANVPFSQFKRQLKAHREQIRKQKRRIVNGDDDGLVRDGEDQRPVYWLHCAAREILLSDLRNGLLSLSEDEMPTETAFSFYRNFDEFKLVPFKQFERQLKAHREQVAKLVAIALPQEKALVRDREVYPVRQTNRHGKQKFYLTEAAELLRDDIKKDRHAGLTPSQFRATRPEYSFSGCGLNLAEFKQRIYQEIRYRKLCNYHQHMRNILLEREAEVNDGKKRKRKRKKKAEADNAAPTTVQKKKR